MTKVILLFVELGVEKYSSAARTIPPAILQAGKIPRRQARLAHLNDGRPECDYASLIDPRKDQECSTLIIYSVFYILIGVENTE